MVIGLIGIIVSVLIVMILAKTERKDDTNFDCNNTECKEEEDNENNKKS